MNEKVADKKIVQNGSSARFEHAKMCVSVYDGKVISWRRAGTWTEDSRPSSRTCDGYFPQEFKSQYPDGIKLDVRDCRSEREPFQARPCVGKKSLTLSDIGA